MKVLKFLASLALAVALLFAVAPSVEAAPLPKPSQRPAPAKVVPKTQMPYAAGLRWALAMQRKAGEQGPFEIEFWGTVDGHHHCYAVIGETSYVWCRDGYRTSS